MRRPGTIELNIKRTHILNNDFVYDGVSAFCFGNSLGRIAPKLLADVSTSLVYAKIFYLWSFSHDFRRLFLEARTARWRFSTSGRKRFRKLLR